MRGKEERIHWRGRNEGVGGERGEGREGGEGRGGEGREEGEREGKDLTVVSHDSAERTFFSLRLVISYGGQN